MRLLTLLGFAVLALASSNPDQAGLTAPDALVSEGMVTPLTHTSTLALMNNRSLNLEPGIRMSRTSDGYSISSFDGRNVEISAGSDTFSLPSPTSARLSSAGWDFGTGKTYTDSAVTAHRKVQDDTDSNLKSMQDSAKKLRAKIPNDKTTDNKPDRKLRVRWVYGENNFATAELFDSPAIQQLSHLSPAGF